MNASNSSPATASSELPSEIWRWDATEIAAHIRLRTITSSDAVQSCSDRIAEVNLRLNAIVHMVADNTLREAKEADAALKNNAPIGPLHGDDGVQISGDRHLTIRFRIHLSKCLRQQFA
jgi:amidase